MITVESVSANGGIESPFVSNTKVLVKYNFYQEIVQALVNICHENK